MANVCEYRVVAEGPQDQLQGVVAFLRPAIETCQGGYYSPNVLDLQKLWPDLVESEEHIWVGLGRFGDEPGNCFRWAQQTFEPIPSPTQQRKAESDCALEQIIEFITEHEGDGSVGSPWDKLSNPTAGSLCFGGACKWAPPIGFLLRLSSRFPDVTFLCGATTEHEYHDLFSVKDGVETTIEEYLEDMRHGGATWYWRDGQKLDPPDEIHGDEYYDDPDINEALPD